MIKITKICRFIIIYLPITRQIIDQNNIIFTSNYFYIGFILCSIMNSNLKLYLHVKKGLILQLKPNAHQQAVNNLNHQGFKRFLTVHSISSRKTSQLINTTLPLFPGYMFTALDKEKSQ